MGSWDYYCALCGACFSIWGMLPPANYVYPKDPADDGYLDNTVVNEESIRWLTQLRLLGENDEVTALKRCYITGIGEHEDYGRANVDPGDHPNVPTQEQGAYYRDGRLQSRTYIDYSRSNESCCPLPLHDNCFKMLQNALQLHATTHSHTEVDLDFLYSALCSRRGDSISCLEGLQYYEFDDGARSQFWCCETGYEPWLSDPLDIPALQVFPSNWPRKSPAQLENFRTRAEVFPGQQTQDPFWKLPTELISQIYAYLPPRDVSSFMRSSRVAWIVTGSEFFWKSRLHRDMPYLWEIHEHSSYPKDVDWHEVYARMSLQSYPGLWDRIGFRNPEEPSPDPPYWRHRAKERAKMDFSNFDPRLIAVASRRRVWYCIQQVLELYLQREEQSKALSSLSGKDVDDIAETAVCMHMPRVSLPVSKDYTPIQRIIVSQWSDIESDHKAIDLHWTNGFLSALVFHIAGCSHVFGKMDMNWEPGRDRTDRVNLDKTQWLEGLELTISDYDDAKPNESRGIIGVSLLTHSSQPICTFGNDEERKHGCKRLLVPEKGRTLVGFKGEYADGKICRLGILESSVDLGFIRTPFNDATTRRFLWKKRLPPPHIHVQGAETSHSSSIDLDMTPIEALLFGTEKKDPTAWDAAPDKIVNFAADVDANSLQYTWERSTDPSFSDRFTERLGYRFDRLKAFPIDGPGGETITGVACRPGGLRIITNRDRQAVFGDGIVDARYERPIPPGQVLAGLFASFSPFEPRVTSMGILTTTGHQHTPDFRALEDTTSYPEDYTPSPWDPYPPPDNWITQVSIPFPGAQKSRWHVLTFLDLSKPITKIEGLFAAPEWFDILELGGFVITYGDGTICWVGAPTPHPPGSMPEDDLPRRVGFATSLPRNSDPGTVPHVNDEEAERQNKDGAIWQLREGSADGELLTKITIWSADYLNGIQFHTASGNSSPKWGKAGGPPSVIFKTPWADQETDVQPGNEDEANAVREDDCVGLKFTLGHSRAGFSAKDVRPQAAHALKYQAGV